MEDWQQYMTRLTSLRLPESGPLRTSMLSVCLGLGSCTAFSSTIPAASPPPLAIPDLPPSAAGTFLADAATPQVLPVTAEARFGDHVIQLEVAETSQQQALGLMHRETLPEDRGMLFPFEPARPVSFWMKNVQFPLDMVFIHQGQIVDIAANVPPCDRAPCPTYGPERLVSQVIELRGGVAAALGLDIGDTVEIRWLDSEDAAASSPNP